MPLKRLKTQLRAVYTLVRSHQSFWIERPAFLWGLSFLVGSGGYLFAKAPWNFLFPGLWALYLVFLWRGPPLVILAAGALYSYLLYADAPHFSAPVEATAKFSLASIQPHATPFEKGVLYKGHLTLPTCTVPCSIFQGGKEPLHKDAAAYFIRGKLYERTPYTYAFKAKEWTPAEKGRSLASFRFEIKQAFRCYLEKKIPKTAPFLGSLATGDVEERSLRYEFGRVGLQHLLSISGFHFGVLLAIASFFLSLILPRTLKMLLLIALVQFYFLFIGSSPAVLRSYLAATLYLIGKLLKRQPDGLNLLGTALLIEIVLDPLASAHLGFQLSFLSCAGILLFMPIFERTLSFALPIRTYQQAKELTLFSQQGYLLVSLLRKALALTLAVNFVLLPFLLYHFHSFPLLSLLYNLFFPLLLGVCLFLLVLSLAFELLYPPLGSFGFLLTQAFTSPLLTLVSYPPLLLDTSLLCNVLPAPLLPLYLFLLLFASISFSQKK